MNRAAIGRPQYARSTWAAEPIASSIPFYLFLTYLLSFFLHGAARFPSISALRPDMLLAMAVLLSLMPYINARIKLLSTGGSKALLFLMGWVVVSIPFVEWPGSVIRENWQPFLKAVLFFYFIALTVDTEKRLKVFTFVFVACQVVRVLEPLHLNLTEGYFGSSTYIGGGEFAGRLSGAPSDVINANGLGFVIATCVPFLHFLLFGSRSVTAKIAYLLLLPPLLYAMQLTMSRGGFIALVVAAWCIFLQSNRKAGMVVAVLIVAVTGWGSMSDLQKDRYLSLVGIQSEQSNTAEGRWRGMKKEFQLGFERPVFGHGLGTTPEAKANIYGKVQAAHNFYAELLIEVGIVGMIIFVIFIGQTHTYIKENKRRISEINPSDDRYRFLRLLNEALHAAFWVYVVYSINYYGLSQDYWYVLAGLAFAFANVLNQVSGGPAWSEVRKTARS